MKNQESEERFRQWISDIYGDIQDPGTVTPRYGQNDLRIVIRHPISYEPPVIQALGIATAVEYIPFEVGVTHKKQIECIVNRSIKNHF